MASSRKPFPPSENPWKYNYDPDVKGSIKFKMVNSIVGVILCGTVIGWSISKYIPLLPGKSTKYCYDYCPYHKMFIRVCVLRWFLIEIYYLSIISESMNLIHHSWCTFPHISWIQLF
jgi:hypothetical protein